MHVCTVSLSAGRGVPIIDRNLTTHSSEGVAAATVVVHIMPIGLGLLYSGLLRRKNALSMLFLSMCTYSVGAIQWFLMGYSLTYVRRRSSLRAPALYIQPFMV